MLMGWMLARVAEHPGVPREVSELPSWFTGAPAVPGARERSPVSAAPPGEAAAAAEGDYADFASGRVKIALTEYEMTPRKARTRPGTVTFVLRNDGHFAHNFHVEGPGVDTTADKFSPGRTVRIEVALQEGEYKISCPLSNHDQRGMHGTLIVTSQLAGK
jgi:plastocyanin